MIELRNTKKYELIAGQIEQMILSSDMKPGDRMLSIQKLYRHFGAAPATVCNALDLLRERGIIVSVPQKGTFVSKIPETVTDDDNRLSEADITEYLESALPMESFFTPSRKNISIKLREYSSPVHRKMWDGIFQAFKKMHRNVDIQVDTEQESGDNDIVAYTDNLSPQVIAESPELRTSLDANSIPEDYFPITQSSLAGNFRPAKPFSISQAWRLYNRKLLDKHCPDLEEKDFKHLITTVMKRYDYQHKAFPAMGTFVQFLPLNLIEEGLVGDDFAEIDFDNPCVCKVLEFNHCMIQKIRKYHQRANDLSIGQLWGDFMSNRLMELDTFSYVLRLLTESKRDDIMVKASPAANHDYAVTRVQLLGVATDSPHAEEVIEFVRFACGPDGQQILAESQCNIPAMRHYAENGPFLNNAPSGIDTDLLKNLYNRRSILDMPLLNSETGFAKANPILSAYYYGKLDLPAALRKLKHIRFV